VNRLDPRPRQRDFVADAKSTWPPRAFVRMKSIRLFPVPGRKKSKFEEYREAWECFEEEAAAVVETTNLYHGGHGVSGVNLFLQLLGAEAEQGFAQAWVVLGLAEVGHFAGSAFRADDFDELIFFGGGPVWEVGD